MLFEIYGLSCKGSDLLSCLVNAVQTHVLTAKQQALSITRPPAYHRIPWNSKIIVRILRWRILQHHDEPHQMPDKYMCSTSKGTVTVTVVSSKLFVR